jgi:hypothetical protein
MSWDDMVALLKRIDVAAAFALFVVPAITAYISGKIGVRRGLEQARKERAFDRTLEWHESTLRVTNNFRFLSRRYDETLTNRSSFLDSDAPLVGLAKQLEECASNLHKALLEAVFFAEKKTISQLRRVAEDVDEIIPLTGKIVAEYGSSLDDIYDLRTQLRSLDGVAVAIHVSLVRDMREQLGLDKLTASDLGLGPEPARSEKLRGFVLARFPFAAKLFPRMFPQ